MAKMAAMAGTRDLEKICNFLRARGVHEHIINNFEYEKMDVEAITQASDNELLLLGLDKKGDILSLRNFVQKLSKDSSKDERRSEKMLLLHEVLKSGKVNKGLKQHKEAKGSAKMRKVQLGWLHFDDEKQSLVSVRTAKGGGTREVDIKLNAGKDDIIDIAKTIFFPDGNSIFGPEHLMTFGLANFQHEDVSSLKVSGVSLAFTLQRYVEKCKMTRVRLYLTSKINTLASLVKPADHNQTSVSETETKQCDSSGDQAESQALSKLEECRKIISEQDVAYEESLAADKAKRQKLMKEVQDVERQSKLQQARLLRTPQEPKESEQSSSVEIKVHHLSLGNVKRNFCKSDLMACVYDWVGSLSIVPEHFQLLDYAGRMLLPSQPVKEATNTTLYMSEAMSTPPLEDGEVTFLGFGPNDWEPIPGTDNYLLHTISETPPEQLLECNESEEAMEHESDQSDDQWQLTTNNRSNRPEERGRFFRQYNLPLLTRQQSPTPFVNLENDQEETDSGSGVESNSQSGSSGSNKRQRILRVRRSLVLRDLITEFLDDGVMSCELKVIMVDGHGKEERGEDLKGIYRDALSSFWQDFYISCTLGERARVPFIRHDFQSDQWTAIGRLIVKGYKDLGYFPVMLSKAFVISSVFGEKAVSDDILLQSFKQYLAPSEEEVVCEALERSENEWETRDEKEDEDLLELLDRFGCRRLPTKENIKSLIREVAHKEIIQRAQYVADCWEGIFRGPLAESKLSTMEGVCSVYQSLEPSTKKVLGMICAFPGTNAERSAVDYLKRFIRGLDIPQLKSFSMLTTGADVICVTNINVEFTKLERLARRPIAHTCGCILEIPSTYDSYADFRKMAK